MKYDPVMTYHGWQLEVAHTPRGGYCARGARRTAGSIEYIRGPKRQRRDDAVNTIKDEIDSRERGEITSRSSRRRSARSNPTMKTSTMLLIGGGTVAALALGYYLYKKQAPKQLTP